MADLTEYDTQNAGPMVDFEPIPPMDYQAMIVESELKQNSAGTGDVLKLVWQIIDGPYQNRKLFTNLNMRHPNADAQRIAWAECQSIKDACGKPHAKQSEELHDIPCWIKVAIQPAGADKKGVWRDARNQIKKYAPLNGQAPAPAAPTPPTRAAATPPQRQPQPATAGVGGNGGGKPPWKR